MPPCLDGLDIVSVPWRASTSLGAVRDRHRRTLTAVIPVTGPQFVVEPRPEQERLLAGWGDVLAQLAVERGVVTRLSWSDLARPPGKIGRAQCRADVCQSCVIWVGAVSLKKKT